MHYTFLQAGVAVLFAIQAVDAAYSIGSEDEIRASAKTIALDLMSYYNGNQPGQVPGILPGPPPKGDYYWWEGGALMGAMIDYWHLTGDATYNDMVSQGMLHQVGDNRDYQPINYTASLGNDDQAFWGMSAMSAAEFNFPNPPPDQPQWLALAQAVFNTQAAPSRHDQTCGGGMRWQIPVANNGYNYKNSIANGCFFNMGARLARYTGNTTYSDWAEKTWDWMTGVGYIDSQYNIYDGAHIETNCTDINRALFSYTYGIMVLGAANMYNFTNGNAKWETRLRGLLNATFETFFLDDIITEVACEPYDSCTTDMLSFKGYVHRWLTRATTVAPFIRSQVLPILRKSATAGVATCTGGKEGRQCGFKWSDKKFDGKTGAGQQMNVLGAITSLLQKAVDVAPLTTGTGGTSIGDPDAGTGPQSDTSANFAPITAGDRAGASFLTIAAVMIAGVMFVWMFSDKGEEDPNADGAEEVRGRNQRAKSAGLMRRVTDGYRGVHTSDEGADIESGSEKTGAVLPLARGRLKKERGTVMDRPKVKIPLLHHFWQPGSKE